ncbi:hypothetical protein LTR29_002041 [Friedmanniomyces endolithicus]|nr:hypothetical protein LTR29_002041 [Friedmanniomyces endolithicus]
MATLTYAAFLLLYILAFTSAQTSSATQACLVLANLHVAYMPKVEYSCENSMVPGNSPGNDVPTLMLTGSGTSQSPLF